MKYLKLITIILALTGSNAEAQDNKKQIAQLIETYSMCVVEKDSAAFYTLFNEGTVIWAAVLADRSAAKENAGSAVKAGSNFSTGSYKGFMRAVYRYGSAEDKFDNIRIVTDGAVASVTMDYSFWANGKMTNWGGKYLGLVKREGEWKISSVIYSIELANYFPQPALKERIKEAQ